VPLRGLEVDLAKPAPKSLLKIVDSSKVGRYGSLFYNFTWITNHYVKAWGTSYCIIAYR
jgi:hypothetical protein